MILCHFQKYIVNWGYLFYVFQKKIWTFLKFFWWIWTFLTRFDKKHKNVIKINQKQRKFWFLKKKNFSQKIHISAHSGGRNITEIIFWHILSHCESKFCIKCVKSRLFANFMRYFIQKLMIFDGPTSFYQMVSEMRYHFQHNIILIKFE
jgi:hypothetical protein